MDVNPTLIWSLLAAIVSTIYFFLIKYYVNKGEAWILVLVVALELLVIYLYYKSLQGIRSGIIYSIINGFSVILGLAIAILVFGENLRSVDILGVSLIVLGIMIVGKK